MRSGSRAGPDICHTTSWRQPAVQAMLDVLIISSTYCRCLSHNNQPHWSGCKISDAFFLVVSARLRIVVEWHQLCVLPVDVVTSESCRQPTVFLLKDIRFSFCLQMYRVMQPCWQPIVVEGYKPNILPVDVPCQSGSILLPNLNFTFCLQMYRYQISQVTYCCQRTSALLFACRRTKPIRQPNIVRDLNLAFCLQMYRVTQATYCC